MAGAISKNQVSDPGPSWPCCTKHNDENIVKLQQKTKNVFCLNFQDTEYENY